MRYFTITDEKSSRFWEIDLKGNTYTLRYGKKGSKGIVKTKLFDSEAEAKKAYEKQIAAKLKKNYVESDSAQTKTSQKPETAEPEAPTDPLASVLTRYDYFRVPDHPTQNPTDLPKPSPFNPKKALANITKVKGHKLDDFNYSRYFEWGNAGIPEVMTREEAHFWLSAMLFQAENKTTRGIKKALSSLTFDGSLPMDEVLEMRFYDEHSLSPHIARPFLTLYGRKAYLSTLESFLDKTDEINAWSFFSSLQYVRHYFTEEDLQDLKKKTRPLITTDNYRPGDHSSTIASILGLSDELLKVVTDFGDNAFEEEGSRTDCYSHHPLLFGLSTKELVSYHTRRLKLPLLSQNQIRGWLAHTGLKELDWIITSIQSAKYKETVASMFSPLSSLETPEIVPVMFAFSSFIPQLVKEWLESHPETAIEGILTALNDETFAFKKEALIWLKLYDRKGFGDLIQTLTRQAPDSVKALLKKAITADKKSAHLLFTDETTPDWLKEGLSFSGCTRKIPWISPEELPSIVLGDKAFTPDQTIAFLNWLKKASLYETPKLITQMKKVAHGDALEPFGLALFDAWLKIEGPQKEIWAFQALGFLGGDETVFKLSPLIKKWPKNHKIKWATIGIDILKAINSQSAMLQLLDISLKGKRTSLVTIHAEICVEKMAKARGLKGESLQDLVADCGLSQKGERAFDYGSRQFHFVLNHDLKPKLMDDSGKKMDNPPKPGKNDDPKQAPLAQKAWRIMKKEVNSIVKTQSVRLEAAMVNQRRWDFKNFRDVIAHHPMMTHLAQRLVWGAYRKNGELAQSFRITNEQDFADMADETIRFDDTIPIGIVHPLELEDEHKDEWLKRFTDYEIIPFFPQLTRPVSSLNENEKADDTLTHLKGITLPAPTLIFGLEKRGWTRGTAGDAGMIDEHSRQFPSSKITAVIHYEGTVGMGYIKPENDLVITHVRFVNGLRAPSCQNPKVKDVMTLRDVPSIAVSEVISDIKGLLVKKK